MPFQKNSTFQEFIDRANTQREKELPFVLFRKPDQTRIQGIFQKNDWLNHVNTYDETGFVFAPFDAIAPPVLIKIDESLTVESEIHAVEAHDARMEPSDQGKEEYMALVNNAIAAIHNSEFQKVVLSRRILTRTKKSPFQIFQDSLQKYPKALCYLWYHPKMGMWLGATPESLLKVEGTKVQTTSLAGTLPFVENQVPQWGEKELEEQQMVTDYISENLEDRITALHISKTESVRAGRLWHLKCSVSGELRVTTNLKELVETLHPTPAVCGVPKLVAKQFIRDNENYNRQFYTGFLGELNLGEPSRSNLYVNLRCMRLNEDSAAIFVGGGITSSSNAEDEWMETQNKSLTMMRLL